MAESSFSSIRKVADNMSFVGMHNTKYGIICFSDTKATKKYENGFITEDIERGKIPKQFKNNQFIFVTYGNNEMFSEKYKTNIEDYIQKNLKENMNYKEFFSQMDEDIQKNKAEYHNGEYNFIIGSKDFSGRYFLERCLIKQGNEILFFDKTYEKKIYTGGDEFYTSLYKKQEFYNDVKDIKEYADKIKNYIEKIIEAKDALKDYHYNPVGLPIQIDVFQ